MLWKIVQTYDLYPAFNLPYLLPMILDAMASWTLILRVSTGDTLSIIGTHTRAHQCVILGCHRSSHKTYPDMKENLIHQVYEKTRTFVTLDGITKY